MTVAIDYLDPDVKVRITEQPLTFLETLYTPEGKWSVPFALDMHRECLEDMNPYRALRDDIINFTTENDIVDDWRTADQEELEREFYENPIFPEDVERGRRSWKNSITSTSRRVSMRVRSTLTRLFGRGTDKTLLSMNTEEQIPAEATAGGSYPAAE